jgi:hypothetical protein
MRQFSHLARVLGADAPHSRTRRKSSSTGRSLRFRMKAPGLLIVSGSENHSLMNAASSGDIVTAPARWWRAPARPRHHRLRDRPSPFRSQSLLTRI